MRHRRSRGLRALALFSLAFLSGGRAARAERFVPAYDPRLHAKPPLMKGVDGNAGPLVVDADFLERAGRRRAERAAQGLTAAEGDVVQNGEVAIVPGNDETLESDGVGYSARQAVVARKVIEKFGDRFQAMTLWLTFSERTSTQAEAYESTVKADVQGLGTRPRDMSRSYGSNGVLRSILNMKTVWRRPGDDSLEAWTPHLETWGQESCHRWMMFMTWRDPRTGRSSDALLGRDCSHYSRFVDTQASVHDGYAWKDNGDGTFTATEYSKRYGNLDLYGMGVMAVDEVPPFFLIDDIPDYKYPRCSDYSSTRKPGAMTIMGKRVDIVMADIVAANGKRVPGADDLLDGAHQDYFREAQVIVTQPSETPDSPMVTRAADRINKARVYWEQWMRTATRNRMVVCTKLSADCGDARSDITDVKINTARKAPAAGPLRFEVAIANSGQLPATGVTATLEAKIGAEAKSLSSPVATIAPGGMGTAGFDVDLRATPCGTELPVKVSTQSDFHYNRRKLVYVVGTETVLAEGFEADGGWVANPDKDDTSAGAVWERAKPEGTELATMSVQPEGAHGGAAAWVTGAAAVSTGGVTFVRAGRSTLESPELDAHAWREPQLRYWVSFAGVQAGAGGGIEPSPNSRLVVLARATAGPPDGGAAVADAGAPPEGWVEIDRLEGEITDGWVERSVRIPPALGGGRLKLRFVAEDANPRSGGAEAAIDDVQIVSNLPACYEAITNPMPGSDEGCGCRLGGRGAAGAWALPGLLGAAALAARARRRRRARR
jgi:hypothetical protein